MDGEFQPVVKKIKLGTKARARLRREQADVEEAAFAATGPDTTKPIEMTIYDRNSPDGTYGNVKKQNALLKTLFELMYRELLSDSKIQPKFSWSGMVDDVFRVVAVGEPSAKFFKDRVEKMGRPWYNARLEVVYKTTKLTKVEAYVPGELISTDQLFTVIRHFDSMIPTIKWEQLAVRPHDQGHVFTFGIDIESYTLLDKCDGYIPYWDSRIEFRILED